MPYEFEEAEAEAEERLIDVFYKLDTSSRPWFSRAESGVPTIILHNLLGFETLRLQSDQILLTNKTLTDVPELLTVDEPQLYDGILPNLTKMAICDTTYDGRVLNKFYVWLGEGLVNGGRALPYAANHCVVNVDGVPVAGYFISTSFPEILAHQQAHKWFPNSPEAVDKTSLVKNLTSYGPIKRLASHTFSSGECDPCSEEAQIEPLSSGLRIYIVKPGDTLQSIAQAEYGEACRAEDIAKYAI